MSLTDTYTRTITINGINRSRNGSGPANGFYQVDFSEDTVVKDAAGDVQWGDTHFNKRMLATDFGWKADREDYDTDAQYAAAKELADETSLNFAVYEFDNLLRTDGHMSNVRSYDWYAEPIREAIDLFNSLSWDEQNKNNGRGITVTLERHTITGVERTAA